MNPAGDNLPSKKADQEHSMSSDDEENASFQESLSLRQGELALEIKRSAVKELIERYFYQLQRGCGNPECSNVNCASSGKVATMTPNEIAAKAIHLFLQDSKLCESYTQPSKVPKAVSQDEYPTSSWRVSSIATPSNINEAFSTRNQSSGFCSTPISTDASSSSAANSSSCTTEKMPVVVALNDGAFTTNAIEPATSTTTNATDASNSVSKSKISDPTTPTFPSVEYLNEHIIDELIDECKKCKTYDRLINVINDVYRSVFKLSKSFRRPPLSKLTSTATASKLQEILGKNPQEMRKEDLRILEGEHDKDEDSTCMDDDESERQLENDVEHASSTSQSRTAIETDTACTTNGSNGAVDYSWMQSMDEDANSGVLEELSHSYDTQLDFESFRRVKKKLYGLKKKTVIEALQESIILLAESLLTYGYVFNVEQVLHCIVICFDMTMTFSRSFTEFEYIEMIIPKICQAAHTMPVEVQAKLARIWAEHCKDYLQGMIESLQQLITLRVITDEDTVQENPDVIAITKVLKIVFYANILAGELDTYNTAVTGKRSVAEHESASSSALGGSSFSNDEDDIFHYYQIPTPYQRAKSLAEDKLEKELNISCMDCRVPFVPFEEFYNEPLSDAVQMDRDYLSYKNLSLDPSGEDNHFSFMMYSFILTPATKVVALYYDSRIRMYSERNSSIYSLLNYFGDGSDTVSQPNLKLKVRRDNIVNDALIGLELVAMSNPKDLKKQLVVEFVGEQGIDEGGVSKEFFQLIVEEIFNPDFGMFTHQEDTNTMWFNPSPFENEAQFTLIGIIIGLAIYNNIILAVNFPMVVYRKLMGGRGSFYDLNDWNPTLYKSLKSLLEYEEPDMEEVFMQTFKISYKNVFDEVIEHELKEGGSEIAVNQKNKREFVDLYSDFLLNKNIERQFKAFKKGFEMVTDESPLKLLFRPEEIELLVCGSRKFDFVELEFSTEYEGGYTMETPIIKDFWSIVHNLPDESKRKLLEFTTGSDRVPVGGLSRLKLLITRHGPDSERLPTSHTCFNVLLLPEYSSKEKLEERLLKAINYSKGFGML